LPSLNPNLEVKIGNLAMKNPVATASGTCGYGDAYADFYHPHLLGALVTKGISLEPRLGNSTPRIAETPAGMLNAIGLENVGMKVFLNEKLPALRDSDVTVIVNFFGNTEDEYAWLAESLSSAVGVHGLEANISCPNVKAGGIEFGTDPEVAGKLVAKIKAVAGRPLWVKLSPNVTDIATIALAVEQAGADAISAINTLKGMAIDLDQRKPILANVTGGLSGPAIKPIALRMVHEIAGKVKIPVVGIGGIVTARDALEFLVAGASAVQIGTASFLDPRAPIQIIAGIKAYLREHNIESVQEIIGTLKVSG